MDTDKDYLRSRFTELKLESLDHNRQSVLLTYHRLVANSKVSCDLSNGQISFVPCTSDGSKRLWNGLVHLITSMPWRNPVGRQLYFFVTCGDHILGMVALTSALAQLRLRDALLGWDKEEKWTHRGINSIYNIQTCVPTRTFAPFLTGKLLVYIIFSDEVSEYLQGFYGDPVLGFETTSLFGKSAMYNRIPFLRYLGLTEGLSGLYLSNADWRKALSEYYRIYPRTKTNRQAPVKFQILDKLMGHYKKEGEEPPFEYFSAEFRRGVYFGMRKDTAGCSVEKQSVTWRQRWFQMRQSKVSQSSQLVSDITEQWLKRQGVFSTVQLSLM